MKKNVMFFTVFCFFLGTGLLCSRSDSNNPLDPSYTGNYRLKVLWGALPASGVKVFSGYTVEYVTGADTFASIALDSAAKACLDTGLFSSKKTDSTFCFYFVKPFNGTISVIGIRPNGQTLASAAALTVVNPFSILLSKNPDTVFNIDSARILVGDTSVYKTQLSSVVWSINNVMVSTVPGNLPFTFSVARTTSMLIGAQIKDIRNNSFTLSNMTLNVIQSGYPVLSVESNMIMHVASNSMTVVVHDTGIYVDSVFCIRKNGSLIGAVKISTPDSIAIFNTSYTSIGYDTLMVYVKNGYGMKSKTETVFITVNGFKPVLTIHCTDTIDLRSGLSLSTGIVDSSSTKVKLYATTESGWKDSVSVDSAKIVRHQLDTVTFPNPLRDTGSVLFTFFARNGQGVSSDPVTKLVFVDKPYMKLIEAAGDSFSMGIVSVYEPVHTVRFFHDFWMDSTEVTQGDFLSLMGVNSSFNKTNARLPCDKVTWYDAVVYSNARSKRYGFDTIYSFTGATRSSDSLNCTGLAGLVIDMSKNGFRLPTEAEWEYACRAGTATTYFWGNTTAAQDSFAWTGTNSSSLQIVATTRPNAFGLYDMTGNVWEWCNDWFGAYSSGTQTDPTGPVSGTQRVERGGGWNNNTGSIYLRSGGRNMWDPGLVNSANNSGFRCVRQINR